MIEHSEARELLELAALEPDGFERLDAGDTPEAATLADHLAGCPSCAAEADRVRASAALVREYVIESPDPELRDRTLALIRQVGRRPAVVASAGPAVMAPAVIATAAPAPAEAATTRGDAPVPTSRIEPVAPTPLPVRRRSLRSVAWPVALVASVILAILGTATVVNSRNAADLEANREAAGELARLASWSLKVSAEPDSQQVSLISPSGSDASGTLLYSPTTTDLVVVARDLPAAPAGQEYRCWVTVDGSTRDIGLMEVGGGLAYWVGPVPGLDQLPAGTPFGVSLAAINGPISTDNPALSGTVGG
jgi:hypothetical protein